MQWGWRDLLAQGPSVIKRWRQLSRHRIGVLDMHFAVTNLLSFDMISHILRQPTYQHSIIQMIICFSLFFWFPVPGAHRASNAMVGNK